MIKLTPSKKEAPKFIAFVCAFLYVVIAGFCIFGVIKFIDISFVDAWIYFLIAILLFVVLIVINYCFSWYKSAEFGKASGHYLLYRVTSIMDLFGNNITEYHIDRCKSYKWKRNNLIVKGDITVYEPMSDGCYKSKIIIYDATREVEALIKSYFGL